MKELFAPFVVCMAAFTAWLLCRNIHDLPDAEAFFHRHHPPLYYLMQFCYTIIAAALLYNVQHLLFSLAQTCVRRVFRTRTTTKP